MLLLFAALWPHLFSAHVLQALGPRTFQPLFEDWFFAFAQENPEVSWKFTSRTSIPNVITTIGLNQGIYDFGLTDFQTPSDVDYENYTNIQVVPFAVSTLVPQVYVLGTRVINIHPADLAQIFMGNITKWNDSRLAASNPNFTLPGADIKVWYRSGSTIFNSFWTAALSAMSPEWASLYGITSVFPTTTNNSGNFYSVNSDIRMNGAVLSTQYSIGYASYAEVVREETIVYARLLDDFGAPLNATTDTMALAMVDAPLDDRLRSNFSVNPADPAAWPLASFGYIVIPTSYNGSCDKHRDLFKFIKWVLMNPSPRTRTAQSGYAPVSIPVARLIIKELGTITCGGEALMQYEDIDYDMRRGPIFILFFMLSILILFGGLFLSIVHVRHFSHTRINLIYSLVFVVGATLTLLAPLFWFFTPNQQYICNARLWTTALGFTVLLGTMFSRTWQLRDIYLLQKKKLETLKYRTSSRSSIIKLALTLSVLMAIQIIILAVWQSTDPLSSEFFVHDELQFEGFYRCATKKYHWFIIQLMFFLSLLLFGVYVIYQTWSFQRKALLIETRWVLLALYNIVLTLFAITPLCALLDATDAFISLIAVISIDLSGGGIVAAVLLPRVLDKLEWSTHSHSNGAKQDTAMSGSPLRTENASKQGSKGRKPSHQKPEHSRTPEAELALRLEEPLPLRAFRKQDRADRDPVIFEESAGLPSSKDGGLIELPSLRRNERRGDSPTMETSVSAIPEQMSPSQDRSSPLQTPSPATTRNSQVLHWNENPIRSASDKTTAHLLSPDLDASSASHIVHD